MNRPASRLHAAIKKTAQIDQATGATFAALANRGLVKVDWREHNVHGQRSASHTFDSPQLEGRLARS